MKQPAISRRTFLAGSMMAAFAATVPGRQISASSTLPWHNWSGGQSAQPAGRLAPATVDELVTWMKGSTGPLRAVGAGHSFSPLVPTDGHLLVLDKISGLLDSDAETLQATFGAGTRLANMGVPLEGAGQGMFNLPDIDRQTLAGATATSTHGTGIEFNSLSGYITGLQMVTASGEVIDADRESDPDFIKAASVGIGALGIVTKIRMQNRSAYQLKKRDWVEKTEDVLKNFDERVAEHRHFEMFPLVHSDYALVLSIDETEEPVNNPPVDPEADAAFAMAMRAWMELPPGMRRPVINGLASQIGPTSAVDASWKILTNIRNNRFNEMEYSIPIEQGAECLREVLSTIAEQGLDVVFPLEYRYIKGDDLLLSMFEGGPRAAISIHRTWDEDYRPYFDVIEPIFWKYGGRPHWGKLHSLGYNELSRLYPGFETFRTLRAELDPEGRLLNDHLRKVFDV